MFGNIDEFCKWVFNKAKHTGYTFIAHYGKGYDFQFIAEWLIAHSVKPNIIHNGQKIMQLEVKHSYNIRFIDSISFTLIPLRDFPKTFGLTELTKGFFHISLIPMTIRIMQDSIRIKVITDTKK